MTTFTPFQPSASAPFQFQPTLDGEVYSAIVTWNVFGKRYYLNLSALDGTLIVALPLIGSPLQYDISLVDGYFTSTLVYREASATFEVSP